VSTIRVGYPKGIAKRHGNKLTVNFWNYRYIIKRLTEVSEEYGIKVIQVNEAYTSHTCSLCGDVHNNGRVFRGLFKCSRTGRVINADLNGAINIAWGCSPTRGELIHLSMCPHANTHSPESQCGQDGGSPALGIGVKWLKTQPLVYRWTSGAGWVAFRPLTSYEAVRVKAVNHKPVNHSKGTLAL
jgi:putative transposase